MTTVDLSSMRIAWIEACWHQDIVSQARHSFSKLMEQHGLASSNIELVEVPGSLEIPLQAKLLAQTGDYAAIVGAGFIINGGIYRHDFVASTVLDGMMQVSLETLVPVLSVVLTPHHFHANDEHHAFFFEHFAKKGEEAAHACIKTLQNMQRFS